MFEQLDVPITELPRPDSEATLDEYLSRPTQATIEAMTKLDDDLLVLGAGGKMGFDLCHLASRSLVAAGNRRRVIAVSRFRDPVVTKKFADNGVETIASDLLDEGDIEALPESRNVIYMVGMKFGATGSPGQTWALNTFLPGLVARRFKRSRIVVLSTGNVYAFADILKGGSVETDPPSPVGEYAQSCLGRERMFQFYSDRYEMPIAIIRLYYANALRYGVLLDIAQKVALGQPIDVTMGCVNVIWQGDANAAILRSLAICDHPPISLNVVGPEMLSVRWLATELASLLGAPRPTFLGEEASTALVCNASRFHMLFGYPSMPIGQLLAWTAHWVRRGGYTLNKPTHFETRDGQY